jgi:murein DD-endopeptidase MepM/ murein hydrolase activator NlpD
MFLTCGFSLMVVIPNLVVTVIAEQAPFGGDQIRAWQLGTPQPVDDSEMSDNGSGSTAAGASAVPHDGYSGPGGPPSGVPLRGPIKHDWAGWKDKPLLGCEFQDPNYTNHTGDDFPVTEGTPVYATMSGKVVFAGDNGPWGSLVVIENNGVQIWLAHNSSLNVSVGDIVSAGDVVSNSGDTGNSTGAHVHYGIKVFSGPDDKYGTWVNPANYFSPDDYIDWPCG